MPSISTRSRSATPPDSVGGGHFNPDDKQHGTLNPMGHHNGDMPQNITIGEGHVGQATFKVTYLSLDPPRPTPSWPTVEPPIMVHEKPDDMKTDPTGNAGNRIACGVIMEPAPKQQRLNQRERSCV